VFSALLRNDWESARDEERGTPFVTAAFAASSDGCLAAVRGRPTAISSPEALRVTHELRSMHDAVLVGVGTVLSDDPQLTTRHVVGASPRRVVMDSQLRTPLTSRLLHVGGPPPILLTTTDASCERAEALEALGACVVRVASSRGGVRVSAVVEALGALGVRSLMVEGGAAILDTFFAEGEVDFVVQTIAPICLAGPNALRLGEVTQMALSRWEPRAFSAGSDTIALGRWSPSAIE
jgi:3,4-dihydroxy 2-butanone 4-phosphate synthase/GTP cyclohydrolase II